MNSANLCIAVIDTPKGARRCRNRVLPFVSRCWRHVPKRSSVPSTLRTLQDMNDCNLCCFWLDRNGKGTHLSDEPGEGSHGGVARTLLGDPSGGRRLDDEGYVHVSYADVFMGDGRKEPTQAQLDYLFDVQQEMLRRGTGRMGARASYIGQFITKQQERLATV